MYWKIHYKPAKEQNFIRSTSTRPANTNLIYVLGNDSSIIPHHSNTTVKSIFKPKAELKCRLQPYKLTHGNMK